MESTEQKFGFVLYFLLLFWYNVTEEDSERFPVWQNDWRKCKMKYLIVVDMQVDFISGSLGSGLATAIVPA